MDGTTALEATTGTLDEAGTPPGSIVKMQVVTLKGAGKAQRTFNINHLDGGGYSSTPIVGLHRNDQVQLHVNVRGVDGNRTDVVTVTPTVMLRPDLAVDGIQAPGKAYVNTPVIINAIVRERNGDVGAHGDCLLLVDGEIVDQALGAWVDAGSSVNCQFTHTFAATGNHALAVRVANVAPGDWNPGNDDAAGSIQIATPVGPLNWAATVTYNQVTDVQDVTETGVTCWDGFQGLCIGQGSSYYQRSQTTNTTSSFTFDAYTPDGAFVAPATVAFFATSYSQPISFMFETVGPAGESDCFMIVSQYDGAQAYFCNVGGATSVHIQKTGGSVSYFSFGSSYQWSRNEVFCPATTSTGTTLVLCGVNYQEFAQYSWTNNSSSQTNGGPFNLDPDITFTFSMTDATGLRYFAGGTVGISDPTYSNTPTHTCFEFSAQYDYTECVDETRYYTSRFGYATGTGGP
jgi:hypothetical protein